MDYIPNDDLDLVFVDIHYLNDTFNIDRNSKGINVYNRFGLSLINISCENDILMLNGRLYDDVDGNITCIFIEGKRLVDNINASTSLFDKSTYFCIGTQYFSDHFPAICTLQLHALYMSMPNSHYNENFTDSYRYAWKDTLKIDFLNKFRHLFQTSGTIYNI